MKAMFKRGFTLIELLVVIAIIAILASILFPVFAKAREKARQTQCINNQRQLAVAVNMYTQDNGEKMPGRPSGSWATTIANYADGKIFDDPSTTVIGKIGQPEYGFNSFIYNTSTGIIESPSSCYMTMDLDSGARKNNYSIDNIESDISKRHAGGTIASFVDGHVEYLKFVAKDPASGKPVSNLLNLFNNDKDPLPGIGIGDPSTGGPGSLGIMPGKTDPTKTTSSNTPIGSRTFNESFRYAPLQLPAGAYLANTATAIPNLAVAWDFDYREQLWMDFPGSGAIFSLWDPNDLGVTPTTVWDEDLGWDPDGAGPLDFTGDNSGISGIADFPYGDNKRMPFWFHTTGSAGYKGINGGALGAIWGNGPCVEYAIKPTRACCAFGTNGMIGGLALYSPLNQMTKAQYDYLNSAGDNNGPWGTPIPADFENTKKALTWVAPGGLGAFPTRAFSEGMGLNPYGRCDALTCAVYVLGGNKVGSSGNTVPVIFKMSYKGNQLITGGFDIDGATLAAMMKNDKLVVTGSGMKDGLWNTYKVRASPAPRLL